MKCDFCDKAAVVHEVTVKNGVKTEHHLCAEHAKHHGIEVASAQPINQLLTQFVVHKAAKIEAQAAIKPCPTCGLTFAQFRQTSVLGCPDCYGAFEQQLAPLIERAHSGGTHHCGKTPRRTETGPERQLQIKQILKEMEEAVAAEQYERAAKLRDRLNSLEVSTKPGESAGAPPSPKAGA